MSRSTRPLAQVDLTTRQTLMRSLKDHSELIRARIFGPVGFNVLSTTASRSIEDPTDYETWATKQV